MTKKLKPHTLTSATVLGTPIMSRRARQLAPTTRGIGATARNPALGSPAHTCIERTSCRPASRLRGRVLSADRLYHGCEVVDFSGSGLGGRPHLAYEKA